MTAFLMAWQMFLWIPCPSTKWDENKRKEMLLWLPIIGLIVGALWYLVYFLFETCGKGIGPVAAGVDRKSTRLNSSHPTTSRMPSSA